jgi:predicted nuclease with TOPRIM domain
MSKNEGVELVSLASQVRTLKIRIEGYRQHIREAEKSYKEHLDRLEAKNAELEDQASAIPRIRELEAKNGELEYAIQRVEDMKNLGSINETQSLQIIRAIQNPTFIPYIENKQNTVKITSSGISVESYNKELVKQELLKISSKV